MRCFERCISISNDAIFNDISKNCKTSCKRCISHDASDTPSPQGPSRGNVWDHAEGISGRKEYVFCNSDQWMDLNNNLFLYIVAHLITLPGFLITSPRSPPAVLSQLQKIHHRVKSKWLRIGFPRSLRGQCVHRRCTEVLLMTWWLRTRR